MSSTKSGHRPVPRRNAAYDKYCQLVSDSNVPPRWTHFRAISTNQNVLADALNRVLADVLNLALRQYGMGSHFATFWMHIETSEEHVAKLQCFWLCQLLAHACAQAMAMKADIVTSLASSSNALEYCVEKYLEEISSGARPSEMSLSWSDCAVLSGQYDALHGSAESLVEPQALASLGGSFQAVTKWFSIPAFSPECSNSESFGKLQKLWFDLHLKWNMFHPEPKWAARVYCILIASACLDLDSVVDTYDISYVAWQEWLQEHFPETWQCPQRPQKISLLTRAASAKSPLEPSCGPPQMYHDVDGSVQASPRQYRPGREAVLNSALKVAAGHGQPDHEASYRREHSDQNVTDPVAVSNQHAAAAVIASSGVKAAVEPAVGRGTGVAKRLHMLSRWASLKKR